MVLEGLVEINGDLNFTEEQGASREWAMLIGKHVHGKGPTVLEKRGLQCQGQAGSSCRGD